MTTVQLCKYLAANHIIVTPSNIPGFLPNCVRIGIGQEWQNDILVKVLSQV
jgi:histidinol-phosphate/aromatic aminotransferase/cobyric acid decarboxylase-like protein